MVKQVQILALKGEQSKIVVRLFSSSPGAARVVLLRMAGLRLGLTNLP